MQVGHAVKLYRQVLRPHLGIAMMAAGSSRALRRGELLLVHSLHVVQLGLEVGLCPCHALGRARRLSKWRAGSSG